MRLIVGDLEFSLAADILTLVMWMARWEEGGEEELLLFSKRWPPSCSPSSGYQDGFGN